MNQDLRTALEADLVLSGLQDHLIRRARVLYQMGFRRISASQMAAVAERILVAATLKDAQDKVASFLAHQLEKLRTREERSGQATSWLLPPLTGGGADTLGETLTLWITEERYLQGRETPKDLDRLASLRRFWSCLHGFYRYEAEIGENMPLHFLGEGG